MQSTARLELRTRGCFVQCRLAAGVGGAEVRATTVQHLRDSLALLASHLRISLVTDYVGSVANYFFQVG